MTQPVPGGRASKGHIFDTMCHRITPVRMGVAMRGRADAKASRSGFGIGFRDDGQDGNDGRQNDADETG